MKRRVSASTVRAKISRFGSLCLLLLTFLFVSALTAGATDFTGYTAIGTADELLALMADSDAWDEKYYLTADIVLPEGSAQSPIGVSASKAFKGVFDGNGHSISGVVLNGASNLGLFGVIDGATIQNLTVEGSVTGTGNNVGGIVGFAYMNCTVKNCTSDLTVSGKGSSGGTGGVFGKVGGSTVGTFVLENCTNKGTVNGKLYTGGIIGLDQHTGAASTTRITGCKNYGKVTGTSSCTAGVFGYYYVSVPSTLELSQCANYGDIQGAGYTGGVLGAHLNAQKADTYAITSSLSELYNCGKVSGTAATTGGVVGAFQTTSASGVMTIRDLMHAGESTALAVFGAVNGSTPVTLSRLYNSVGDTIVGTAAETVTLDGCVTAGGDTSVLTGDAWTETDDGVMLTKFYTPKVLLEVVYLKSGGKGDGSSPEQACGTYTAAFDALDLTKDCTIVICGPVTQTKLYNYGEEYTGSITFTSVYGGVDYRESGAVLNVGEARFVCCGDTRFENIHINATGSWWYLIASHHPLTMGEGIEVTGAKLSGTVFAKSIAILGGYQSDVDNPPLSDDKDVNITVLSGCMYYIIPFNRGMAGTYSGNANIYIGGDAEVATLHGSSANDNSNVGNVYVTLTDDASIRTFYGSTQTMTENSFTLFWRSGSIGNWYWDCPSTSDKHITYTEGTALYASVEARAAANYPEIAEKFDTALRYEQWCAEHGGHAYANGVCDICGLTECDICAFESVVLTPSDCTVQGETCERCKRCFLEKEGSREALPLDPDAHDYAWDFSTSVYRYACTHNPEHVLCSYDSVGRTAFYVSDSGSATGGFSPQNPTNDFSLAFEFARRAGTDATIYVVGRVTLPDNYNDVYPIFAEPAHTNRIQIRGYGSGIGVLGFDSEGAVRLGYILNGETEFEQIEFSTGVSGAPLYLIANHNHLTLGEKISIFFARGKSLSGRLIVVGGCYSRFNSAPCDKDSTRITVKSGIYHMIIGGSISKSCALESGTIQVDLLGDIIVGGAVTGYNGYTDQMLMLGSYNASCGDIYATIDGNISCTNAFCIGSYGGATVRTGEVSIKLLDGLILDYAFPYGARYEIYDEAFAAGYVAGQNMLPRYTTIVFPFGADWNHALLDGGMAAYVEHVGVFYSPSSRTAIESAERFRLSLGGAENVEFNPYGAEPCTANFNGLHNGVPYEDDEHSSRAATCTAEGYTWYQCSDCGKVYYEVNPILPHTFGAYGKIADATCIAPQRDVRYCEICGKAEYRRSTEYPATGEHLFDENGTCTGCGKDKTELCDHDAFGYISESVSTRCGSGIKQTCKGCGKVSIKITSASHSFGPYTVTVEPTENAPGIKTRTCKSCGKIETALLYAGDAANADLPLAVGSDGTLSDTAIEKLRLTKAQRTALTALLQEVSYGSEIKVSYQTDGTDTGITYSIPLPEGYADMKNIKVVVKEDDGTLTEVDFAVDKGYIVFTF